MPRPLLIRFLSIVMTCFVMGLITGGKTDAQENPDTHHYSVAELQSDFLFLRNKIEKHHPNLYLYTSKQTFDRTFDSLYKRIDHPMTGLEFFNHFTPLYTKIKNGHTLFLPNAAQLNAYNQQSPFIPFDLRWINEKLVVFRTCTSDTSVLPGAEIISINGVTAKEIMDTLFNRQVRDGYCLTYPDWILNQYFREYYSFSFGHPQTFQLVYQNPDGRMHTGNVLGLKKDSIRFYRTQRYPNSTNQTNVEPDLAFDFDPSTKTATLKISSFDNAVLKSSSGQSFSTCIPDFFTKLAQQNSQNLILDLRDNQGGDAANGKLLLSYLIDHPFALIYKGPYDGLTKPVQHPFAGDVYVLINGGSFSMTAMVASCLEANRQVVFIGQETGGAKTILAGSARSFKLPQTKIYCEIPYRTWQIRNEKNEGRGIVPTILVIPTIYDLIRGVDPEKEKALEQIGNKK